MRNPLPEILWRCQPAASSEVPAGHSVGIESSPHLTKSQTKGLGLWEIRIRYENINIGLWKTKTKSENIGRTLKRVEGFWLVEDFRGKREGGGRTSEVLKFGSSEVVQSTNKVNKKMYLYGEKR